MLERLPRRERQLLDTLFSLGQGGAEEIRSAMRDAPSNSAIRAMLTRLEAKGFVTHRVNGSRYVYTPTIVPKAASESALRQVVTTFFAGSAASAAKALLGMAGRIDEGERRRLDKLIKRARDNER
jgi:predicted transcriptional regulator